MTPMSKEQSKDILAKLENLEGFVVETNDIFFDRLIAMGKLVSDVLGDVFEDKKTFLGFVGDVIDAKWNAGILEPIDDKIGEVGVDKLLTLLAGPNWFEKVKDRVDNVIIEDNTIKRIADK